MNRKASLGNLTIKDGATLRQALEVIERGAAEIALVVDESGRLLGGLTDGDVRRALLGGAGLDSSVAPFVNQHLRIVGLEAGRAEVMDLMRAYSVQQIPIVDQENRLIGIHLLREIVGAVERANWAVLMAGGRGRGLDPLTRAVPKPMLPVAGRPILERLLLHLVGFGFRRIFLSVHYLGSVIEEHFGDGKNLGCHIEYLREEKPLGTCGSLSLLPELPEHPVLVMNGDLVTNLDVGELLSVHSTRGYAATVGVRTYVHEVPFGVVESNNGYVTRIMEKPSYSQTVSGGVYVLNPELVAQVPKNEAFDMPMLLEQALLRGYRVGTYVVDTDWIDVGRIEQLKRAQGQED